MLPCKRWRLNLNLAYAVLPLEVVCVAERMKNFVYTQKMGPRSVSHQQSASILIGTDFPV